MPVMPPNCGSGPPDGACPGTVGMMLPAVVRYNGRDGEARAIYTELAKTAGLADAQDSEERAVEALALRLEDLLSKAGVPRTLPSTDIASPSLPELAREAAAQWTGNFNPRELTVEAIEEIYRSALA